MRDTQKQAVYDAEQIVRNLFARQYDEPLIVMAGSTIKLPEERKFGDLESVQRYVNLITKSLHLSPVVCKAQRADAYARAYYQMGAIHLPVVSGRWAMREIVVLHELAHHCAPGDNHGSQFTDKFLELVRFAMGAEAEFILRITFYETGVQVG